MRIELVPTCGLPDDRSLRLIAVQDDAGNVCVGFVDAAGTGIAKNGRLVTFVLTDGKLGAFTSVGVDPCYPIDREDDDAIVVT